MGLLNRLFLCLYALAVLLLTLGAFAFVFPLLPEFYFLEAYSFAAAQWETTAGVLAVLFLLSVHFLVSSLTGTAKKAHEDKEVILVHSASGDVKVAVEAVRNMMEKLTRAVPGVREAKVRVRSERSAETGSSVKIGIHIVIGQEQNVAAISDAIRSSAEQHLHETVGVQDFALEIAVDDISNAAVTKKQRVV